MQLSGIDLPVLLMSPDGQTIVGQRDRSRRGNTIALVDLSGITFETVTYPEFTINADGTASREMVEERVAVVYVNSVSGGVAETGDGTAENPLVNLQSILSEPFFCKASFLACAGMAVLFRVSGTVDYAVSLSAAAGSWSKVFFDFSGCTATGGFLFNFYRTNATIMNLTMEGTAAKYPVTGQVPCVFRNCRLVAGSDSGVWGMVNTDGHHFDNCHISGTFAAADTAADADRAYSVTLATGSGNILWDCSGTVDMRNGIPEESICYTTSSYYSGCEFTFNITTNAASYYKAVSGGEGSPATPPVQGSGDICRNCKAAHHLDLTADEIGTVIFSAWEGNGCAYSGCTGSVSVNKNPLSLRACGFTGSDNVYEGCIGDRRCYSEYYPEDCEEFNCAL